MEYYRYQVKSKEDFKKFTAWLIENKITFTSQHNYIPEAGEHVYHVTAYVESENESNVFAAIGSFLDSHSNLIRVTHMPSQITSAKEAVNDMYADAETLRVAAKSLFYDLKTQQDKHIAEVSGLNVELDKVKKDKDYYVTNYCKELRRANRVREQVKAIALLMDAIFPDEKK